MTCDEGCCKFVCNESGEKWNEEGTYFDRYEECSVCDRYVKVRYHREVVEEVKE